ADDDVGLDQGQAEALERDGLAAPAGGGGLGAVGVAVGDEDAAGSEGLEVLERQIPHLAGADDQDGLVAEGVEDVAGDVDGDAGDGEAALVHAGGLADLLADVQGLAEDGVEDRADGPLLLGGVVGLLDLAEDLALAEDQALEAGGDAEEVVD